MRKCVQENRTTKVQKRYTYVYYYKGDQGLLVHMPWVLGLSMPLAENNWTLIMVYTVKCCVIRLSWISMKYNLIFTVLLKRTKMFFFFSWQPLILALECCCKSRSLGSKMFQVCIYRKSCFSHYTMRSLLTWLSLNVCQDFKRLQLHIMSSNDSFILSQIK